MSVLPDPEERADGYGTIEEAAASLDELERAFERRSVAERTILVLSRKTFPPPRPT